MLIIALMAVIIGAIGAFIALILLRLITFFTNLFFFQRLSFANASPADNHLGLFIILVPVIGGLIIGLMARYGSDRIRGHGIPEAIESILINGSRIDPKGAVLKPLSSAISIGSGGPVGAVGAIIRSGASTPPDVPDPSEMDQISDLTTRIPSKVALATPPCNSRA
ncbi:MAG: chloride channel protein, partial [Thermomicrobiales bacterium]